MELHAGLCGGFFEVLGWGRGIEGVGKVLVAVEVDCFLEPRAVTLNHPSLEKATFAWRRWRKHRER